MLSVRPTPQREATRARRASSRPGSPATLPSSPASIPPSRSSRAASPRSSTGSKAAPSASAACRATRTSASLVRRSRAPGSPSNESLYAEGDYVDAILIAYRITPSGTNGSMTRAGAEAPDERVERQEAKRARADADTNPSLLPSYHDRVPTSQHLRHTPRRAEPIRLGSRRAAGAADRSTGAEPRLGHPP